ncbi:MAG: hypothetical protein ACLRWM_01055 [Streptococcus sp.]
MPLQLLSDNLVLKISYDFFLLFLLFRKILFLLFDLCLTGSSETNLEAFLVANFPCLICDTDPAFDKLEYAVEIPQSDLPYKQRSATPGIHTRRQDVPHRQPVDAFRSTSLLRKRYQFFGLPRFFSRKRFSAFFRSV